MYKEYYYICLKAFLENKKNAREWSKIKVVDESG